MAPRGEFWSQQTKLIFLLSKGRTVQKLRKGDSPFFSLSLLLRVPLDLVLPTRLGQLRVEEVKWERVEKDQRDLRSSTSSREMWWAPTTATPLTHFKRRPSWVPLKQVCVCERECVWGGERENEVKHAPERDEASLLGGLCSPRDKKARCVGVRVACGLILIACVSVCQAWEKWELLELFWAKKVNEEKLSGPVLIQAKFGNERQRNTSHFYFPSLNPQLTTYKERYTSVIKSSLLK